MDIDTSEDLLNRYFPPLQIKKAARREYIRKKVAQHRKYKAQHVATIAAVVNDTDSDLDLSPANCPVLVSDVQSSSVSNDESDCNTLQSLHRCVQADASDMKFSDDDLNVSDGAVRRIEEIEECVVEKGSCSGKESDSSDDESDCLGAPVQPDPPHTLWYDLRAAVYATNMNTVQVDAVLTALHKHKIQRIGYLPKSEKALCKAEGFITEKLGTVSTETEVERLISIGDRAAQQEKAIKKQTLSKTLLLPLNTPPSNGSSNRTPVNQCTPTVTPSTSGVYNTVCIRLHY